MVDSQAERVHVFGFIMASLSTQTQHNFYLLVASRITPPILKALFSHVGEQGLMELYGNGRVVLI